MIHGVVAFNILCIALHLGLVGAQRGRNILVAAALAVPAFGQYTIADQWSGYDYYAAAAASSILTCLLVWMLPAAKLSNAIVWLSVTLILINGLGYALNFNYFPPLLYNIAVAVVNVLLTIILIPGGLSGLAGLGDSARVRWRHVKLRYSNLLHRQSSTEEADRR